MKLKKKKLVTQKQLYEKVKKWYNLYRDEGAALHEISKAIPFKAYHYSGAMELMFEDLMRDRKASDNHLKKLARAMANRVNGYVARFFQDNPDATIEDLDKLSDEDLYD
ncbi:MAG: hypothetical protein J6Y02_04435 [Pseudobutyrivibrio sp.]|nr:hypothetical protein [Pseudobutyrivibrio sp.]